MAVQPPPHPPLPVPPLQPPPNPLHQHQRLIPQVPKSYAADQNSLLHVACYKGGYQEALMLLLSGHDASSRNIQLETPLHQCTAQGHLELIMLLLDAGTDVNSVDHQSITPLHQAIIHGNKDAAELLLCYGASVYNAEGVTDTLSALELADHVHVCHQVVTSAEGRVWPLQHICRIAIRKFLGVGRRRRIKELTLPKHLLSYLCTLPVAKSKQLHENWDRVRTTKAESVRKRGEARKKSSKCSPGIHMIRNPEL